MVVVGIVGLLATIAICNFISARDNSRIRIIQRNLSQIETAKSQWALDYSKNEGEPVADVTVIADYLRGGIVKAVVHETYLPNPIGTLAEATLPAGMQLGQYGVGASIPAP